MIKKEDEIRITAWLSLLGAVGLLIWWFSMAIFLPIADASDQFENLVLDDFWIPVNMIGVIATLFMTLGLPCFYLRHSEKFRKGGFYGLLIACAGLILFTGIQYYETLLWPAAAKVNPELLQVNGALVSGDVGVLIGLITSGILLGCGYIFFGISALKTQAYPKAPLWMLMFGAPLFGAGIAFSIRTVGLLLFCTGTLWLASMFKKGKS